MPETMGPGYAAAEWLAYRSVRRACVAGLDSITLRAELTQRVTRLSPAEASWFGTLDPRTGRREQVSGVDVPDVERRFFDAVYPLDGAERMGDLTGTERAVTTDTTPGMATLMHRAGLGRELRAMFAAGNESGAMWLALRERRSRPFGEHDVAFVRRIAPHVAGALRRAALVDAAEMVEVDDYEDNLQDPGDRVPSVVVIDDRWRVTHATAAAGAHLADLADATQATSTPTSVLIDLVARQQASGGRAGVVLASVRGRSGRWYTLRAALSEPDALGRASTVVIIAPARRDTRPNVATPPRRAS
jgi:hypothetical protein